MKWFLLLMTISFSALAQEGDLADPCKEKSPQSKFECNKVLISRLKPVPLPDICRSAKSQDRASCGMWIVKNQIPEACQSQKEENIAKCETWLQSQMSFVQEKGMKSLSTMDQCEMSPDQSQITCGEKVYVLSGSVNNMKRVNSKIDLNSGSSKASSSKPGTSKAQ